MVRKVWQIQRDLQYAQARQAYYADTTRPQKPDVDPVPRQAVGYKSILRRISGAAPTYIIQASSNAVGFFGGIAALQLVDPAGGGEFSSAPRSFRPSLIKAMTGDNTPVPVTAYGGTGRRYIKYSSATEGAAQAHYQAPISGNGTTPTWDDVLTTARAINNAKATELGTYGKLYTYPEHVGVSHV